VTQARAATAGAGAIWRHLLAEFVGTALLVTAPWSRTIWPRDYRPRSGVTPTAATPGRRG
jgi:hypothetical protein